MCWHRSAEGARTERRSVEGVPAGIHQSHKLVRNAERNKHISAEDAACRYPPQTTRAPRRLNIEHRRIKEAQHTKQRGHTWNSTCLYFQCLGRTKVHKNTGPTAYRRESTVHGPSWDDGASARRRNVLCIVTVRVPVRPKRKLGNV